VVAKSGNDKMADFTEKIAKTAPFFHFMLILLHFWDMFNEYISLLYCIFNRQHNFLCLALPIIQQQPPRALRNIPSHDKERSDSRPPYQKHQSPVLDLPHHHRQQRGQRTTQVPCAVYADVHPSPVSRRQELVDSREDCRKLSTDTGWVKNYLIPVRNLEKMNSSGPVCTPDSSTPKK
jgi:hypothetical protein